MIWLLALGILGGFACIPWGVLLAYDAKGLRCTVRVGPVTVFRYPGKAPKDKAEKDTTKASAGEKKAETPLESPESETEPGVKTEPPTEETPKEQGGSLTGLMPFVKLAWRFLGALRRKLVVNRLELNLILGGDDPCDLAVNYGRAMAAKESLMPLLERYITIRKRKIDISWDFEASQTRVTALAEITITLGRALALALVYGVQGLKEYWNWKKKPKGGAEHESETTQHAGDSHSENP